MARATERSNPQRGNMQRAPCATLRTSCGMDMPCLQRFARFLRWRSAMNKRFLGPPSQIVMGNLGDLQAAGGFNEKFFNGAPSSPRESTSCLRPSAFAARMERAAWTR
jgi:hypothetical protein